ncbi:MAG: hypothetical protein N3F63_01725 [Thermoplasmata archaeon]|nr:hypothetical protein [Thermoplasmata archaeon]
MDNIYREENSGKWERIHAHMIKVLEKSLGTGMVTDVIKVSVNDFSREDVRASIKATVTKIYVALGEEMTYNLLTNTVLAEIGNDRDFLEECYNLVKEVSQ